ncbi:MAG: hypothetical protein JSU96_09315 [Acidobacteriota bacterium]|nr:MAG: hypothetical protein JSU96_09315 [Acidobacteriota bacterium]
MIALQQFLEALTDSERAIFSELDSPVRIQTFLDRVTYSSDPIYRCPLRVFRERKGHCYDGAVFAALALSRIGLPPLILELLPNERDDDHILAVFKRDGYWGAIAKSNFVGLRFREPIHRNLRELVMTYFEPYFNVEGERTLRGYTVPLNLGRIKNLHWATEDGGMDVIAERLDQIRKFSILTPRMIDQLTRVDERSVQAGLTGSVASGLFKLD